MKRIAIRIVSAVLLIVVLLGVAVSIAGMVYRPQAAIPSGFAGSYVDVAGIPLRVVQEGSGRDILMIHGSPGILEDFDAQARDLRTSFRVTRYDRPGQGFSGDTGNYSIRDNARVALALIEKLGLTNTIVVGHSYGGATALALGEMKSPRVAALVILDSAAYTSIRAVNPLFRFLRLPAFGVGMARMVRGTTEGKVRESIPAEFKAGAPPENFLSVRAPIYSEPKVVHAMANEHWDSTAELALLSPHYAEIDVPVYIVAQRDDAARSAQAERLQREVAHGNLTLVSPSGHYVQVEQPAAVTEVIQRAAGS
ncbi:MAG TPA: alpha/beta hydrolase [Candidatus Limnocylindrales bacterium]|nr:alpha/beta hydrolase [Candidatus Limnocylindrales bacterium]